MLIGLAQPAGHLAIGAGAFVVAFAAVVASLAENAWVAVIAQPAFVAQSLA